MYHIKTAKVQPTIATSTTRSKWSSSRILLLSCAASVVACLSANAASIFGTTATSSGPLTGSASSALGAPDGGFVQIDGGSQVTVHFAPGSLAYADGTSGADLRIYTFDALAVSTGKIFLSGDGVVFTSVGVFSDSHPPGHFLGLDLDGLGFSAVSAVRIQDTTPFPAGFDLDAVEGLHSTPSGVPDSASTAGLLAAVCGMIATFSRRPRGSSNQC